MDTLPPPFLFGAPVFGPFFIGRKSETSRLKSNFEKGISTALTDSRRTGKTSLLLHASETLQKKEVLAIAFVDLFGCHTQGEFLARFASAVLTGASPNVEEKTILAQRFLSTLSPRLQILSDSSFRVEFPPDLTSSTEAFETVLSLPEIIAEEIGLHFLICLDEFQQTAEFEDSKGFLERLAGTVRGRKNAVYWIASCRKTVMEKIFETKDSPFFGFADNLSLGEISAESWERFLVDRFAGAGKNCSRRLGFVK